MLDSVDHHDEVIIGSLFVYDEWILLCISFKCHFFTKVSHTVYMEHPELIDTCEGETTFELSELFLSPTISECLDLACEECLCRFDQ